MRFDVLNRYTDAVQFTAEIDATEATPRPIKLRLAVLWAIKTGANFSGANLTGADLIGADLIGADLTYANFTGADLSGANLSCANLSCADLTGANLTGADLTYANLTGANFTPLDAARLLIVPQEGDVIGWKKCEGNIIVKLLIRDGVPRHNATGRKCRAERAEVLEVIGAETASSSYDPKVKYTAGQTVIAENYDPNRFKECAGGIHFYITREEAEAHS